MSPWREVFTAGRGGCDGIDPPPKGAICAPAGGDGFRLLLKGKGEQEFQQENLIYGFDEKFSLSGMFQRLDNFFDKGLEQSFQNTQANVRKEIAELDTVKTALGQDFPQQGELVLVRENHSAVMRELKRMQDEPGYVSSWEPKVELAGQSQQGCAVSDVATKILLTKMT